MWIAILLFCNGAMSNSCITEIKPKMYDSEEACEQELAVTASFLYQHYNFVQVDCQFVEKT